MNKLKHIADGVVHWTGKQSCFKIIVTAVITVKHFADFKHFSFHSKLKPRKATVLSKSNFCLNYYTIDTVVL